MEILTSIGDTFTDGSVKCTMTSMTASEPVVSLAVSPFSKDSGNKYVFPPTLRAFSDWWVRLLLEEILWDKKYDMDLYRCKDVLSIFNLVEIHSVQIKRNSTLTQELQDFTRKQLATLIKIGFNLHDVDLDMANGQEWAPEDQRNIVILGYVQDDKVNGENKFANP
ncbi:hypothetical protein Tco_0270010, partial [Tanacetum coccineum]